VSLIEILYSFRKTILSFYNSHNPQHCKLTDITYTFSVMQAVGEATHATPTDND